MCVLLVVSAACPGWARVYVPLNQFFTMAKGSFNGVIRGKKGNTVFYKITNSNNKEKQGWREYSATIANPQTDGQIDQRCKMQAVNNLYRALKSIITRGFENHKYGDESRRAWLKLALSASFNGGPILRKGSTIAAPIPGVPIMYGSLAPVGVQFDDSYGGFVTNLQYDDQSDYNTIGGLSQIFIDNGYREGDQVTMVWGDFGFTLLSIAINADQEYAPSYHVFDFYIDTTDSRATSDVLGIVLDDTDGEIGISSLQFSPYTSEKMVLAISVSRNGETSNLRSAAYFAIGSDVESAIYDLSDAQIAARKATYRKSAASNVNWPQVPGGEGGVTPGTGQEAVTNDGVTRYVTALTSTGTGNNYRLLMPGSLYVRGVIREGTSDTVVYLCDNGVTTQQAPADGSNANTVNACSSTNVNNGLRQWLIDNGVAANQLVID